MRNNWSGEMWVLVLVVLLALIMLVPRIISRIDEDHGPAATAFTR